MSTRIRFVLKILLYSTMEAIPIPMEAKITRQVENLHFAAPGRTIDQVTAFLSRGIRRPCMPEAVIVSAVRTPVGRADKGSRRPTRPDDLAAAVIQEALSRAAGLDPREIDDVILGCAMPEGEQGMNVARIAALRAGLPLETSAMTINRFCSSGLQAIALGAERIRTGAAQVIVAGGTESMSMVPMGGNKISPNPWLVDHYPDAYINMGLGTENIARKFGITREQADRFSAESHKKPIAAIA